MADPGVRIRIASEFVGKGFKDAGKATSALDKNVKQLGKSLAAVFGAQQLLKFAKNAASAFIEDQREATRLAIAVKNLGLAFEAPAIEDYIQKLSRLSGVTDSQLRPSMQALLQITGSVTESQKILNQALDVSAATGIDVATVSQDIGRAYTGNTRGLRKYNLGLTQAELTTSSYVDVQARLNTLFGGANAAQLQTYAGQMSLLTVAAGEASETIGKGLIDAMITLTESKDVTDFVNKIDSVAQSISNAIGSISRFIQVIKLLPSSTGRNDPRIAAIFDPARNAQPLTSTNVLGINTLQKQEAQRKKVEADAMKRAKELLSVQKKNLDTQKKQNALTKASKTLNLEAISIEAALKGQISETDRLSLMLQKSILDGNANLATSLSDQLDAAVRRNNALQAALLATPEAPNPYRNWTIPADLLNYTAVSLGVSPETVINAPQTIAVPTEDPLREIFDAVMAAQVAQDKADAAAKAAEAAAAVVNVKVEVAGEEVAAVITQQQTNQSLSGSFNTVNRVDRFRTLAI
jgi:hypothetical protein